MATTTDATTTAATTTTDAGDQTVNEGDDNSKVYYNARDDITDPLL